MSGWTSAAVAIGGTVLSMVGQQQQGRAQQKAANEQAQQVLNEGAYRADAAKQQAEKIRKAGAAQKGEARASLAASGVKLGEGTPLEVDREITQNSEEDALSALISGKRATSAAQEESKMLAKAGRNAMTSSVLESGGTLAKGWKVLAQKGS
jgi:hypothetical protein